MLLGLTIKDLFQFLKHWRVFFLYCCLIYVSLPIGPEIWKAMEHSFGGAGKDLPAMLLGLSFTAVIIRFLSLRKKYVVQGFFIIIVAFFLFYRIADNIEFSSEKMHLIEYAILAIVIYSRIDKDQSVTTLHFKILIIGFIVGSIDEYLQRFIPGRVCDIRDVLLNSASVSLAQMVIYSLEHLC